MRNIVIFSIILISNIYSQNYNWTYLHDGNSPMPAGNVTDVAVDKNSIKWFGIANYNAVIPPPTPLIKFDGNEWNFYSTRNSPIPSNYAHSVAVDSMGRIWIGTDNGLAVLEDTLWTIYTTNNSPLPHNKIFVVKIDRNGDIWIGTLFGLVKYDGVNWTVHNSNWIKEIEFDNLDNIWVYAVNVGLIKYDGIDSTIYNENNSGLPSILIHGIGIDSYNVKWIATYYDPNTGLVRFDDINWTIYNPGNSPLPDNRLRSVSVDKNDIKWIGLVGYLVRFDDVTWEIYNINSDDVNDIEILDDGTIWLGLHGGVAYGTPVTTIPAPDQQSLRSFILERNYPNPFNSSTTISFKLPKALPVDIEIYSISGQKTYSNRIENTNAGMNEFKWNAKNMNGRDISSGLYFYSVNYNKERLVGKMLLVK